MGVRWGRRYQRLQILSYHKQQSLVHVQTQQKNAVRFTTYPIETVGSMEKMDEELSSIWHGACRKWPRLSRKLATPEIICYTGIKRI